MRDLVEQYLSEQGINESFSAAFLRYTENLYKDESGNYQLDFPRWKFSCPKPTFTSEEVEASLKAEYKTAHTDGIENKYINDEATKQAKLDELNALIDLDLIINFTY